MQPPAKPRLVARGGLLACGQLLPQLHNLHRHEVFGDCLHGSRRKQLWHYKAECVQGFDSGCRIGDWQLSTDTRAFCVRAQRAEKFFETIKILKVEP